MVLLLCFSGCSSNSGRARGASGAAGTDATAAGASAGGSAGAATSAAKIDSGEAGAGGDDSAGGSAATSTSSAGRDSGGAGAAGTALDSVVESEPNDDVDSAQRIAGPAAISASSGGDDFEDVYTFVAPQTASYDILLEDFETPGYDLNVYTTSGSVSEVASTVDGADELVITVDLAAGEELIIDVLVLSEVEQTYTLTILESSLEDPGTVVEPDDAGEDPATDYFAYETSDGEVVYEAGDAEVELIDAYFSDDPDPGALIIVLMLTDGSGFHFIIDGREATTYGGSDGIYSRNTAAGNVYQDGNASGPQEVVVTRVGAVGEKVEGTFTVTVKLVGCDSCSNTTYRGRFSITRSR
jgi:hypothetical protein